MKDTLSLCVSSNVENYATKKLACFRSQVDNAIIIQWIIQLIYLVFVCRIVIYVVCSALQDLNNQSQVFRKPSIENIKQVKNEEDWGAVATEGFLYCLPHSPLIFCC